MSKFDKVLKSMKHDIDPMHASKHPVASSLAHKLRKFQLLSGLIPIDFLLASEAMCLEIEKVNEMVKRRNSVLGAAKLAVESTEISKFCGVSLFLYERTGQ